MQATVEFMYHTDFSITDEESFTSWLIACAQKYNASSINLVFAFMDDASLHALNLNHLKHDTLTDIITFDDTVGTDVVANIAISVDRIEDNSTTYSQSFQDELLRVMSHGLLHCLGFNDKTEEAQQEMRAAEDSCMKLFHVEHKTTNHVS